MYCLWLNGKKVYTLQQLRASFDAEAVELYCLGGGLSRWLRDCGEQDTARKVEQIDLSRSVSRQLADIFGVELPETEEQAYVPATTAKSPFPAADRSFAVPPSSFSDTSFFTTSFDTTSFSFSQAYTSFFTTSFLTTSFGYEHEHEYEYESGSFAANSFSLSLNSFSAETAFLTGSFALGSFTLGSFTLEYGFFPIGSGSFHLALSSFSPKSLESTSTESTAEKGSTPLTPQQKFELNLSSCPLNRYGYGIHII